MSVLPVTDRIGMPEKRRGRFLGLQILAAAAQGCQTLAHAPLAVRPPAILLIPLSLQTNIFLGPSVVLYLAKLAHQQQIDKGFEIIYNLHIFPNTHCRFYS